MVDFDQTKYTETPLGLGKEVISFWWPWSHFQNKFIFMNKITLLLQAEFKAESVVIYLEAVL